MQITRYRITDERGSVRYTERIGEASDAAKVGNKVEKRRVSINERHGGATPLSSWRVAIFKDAPTDRVIQYRIYLNPNEHFETLEREQAVEHWKEGKMIYSRAVDYYPKTKGVHPVGYWRPHPPKEMMANVPGRYPELTEEDIEKNEKEEGNVSSMGNNEG